MPDMEEMIKQEISRISGLEERVAFKDIVEQVFLSLYEANQEMYHALESRVMDDLAFDINRYRVCTGIMEREYVDKSHHLLAPMREEDLEERDYDTGQLLNALQENGSYLVKTLFIECDFLKIKKLLSRGRLGGRILTAEGVYPAEFMVRMNRSYLQEIIHLYEIFVSNGISWQTVNAPYLYKFVDVYLISDHQKLSAKEKILQIEPDLEEFEEWAHDNYVPLWNIRKMTLNSVGFPVPCEDHKSFEHIISVREYGDEHIYLIDDTQNIYHVRQMPGRIIVMGKESEARKWGVYMIRSGENRKFDRFTYPVMTNHRSDEFVERFFRRQGIQVRTEAELARFIRGFGLEEYVAFEGYEITDSNLKEPETYSMNDFILDEIREKEARKCLLLKFRGKGKLTFLLRDIISFLVSEVQILYPEYLCEGKLG